MDFVTGLPISINQKGNNYNSILVIFDWFIKIVNYKPIIISINTPRLEKVESTSQYINTVFWTQLSPIDAIFSPQNFGYCFVIFLASSIGFLFLSICKLTAKPKDKIVLWMPTSNLLSFSNRTISLDSYQQPSLLIPMLKTQAPAIRLLN